MSPSHRSLNMSTLTLLLAALFIPAGASAAGKLAFTSAALDFGSNALGEIKTKAATLKNGTTADIALNAATLADNTGGYVIASTTCGATLAAGQSCKYTLRYIAKTLQLAQARLELTTLDPSYPLLVLPLQANRYPALNDTGITRCSNDSDYNLTCPTPGFPRQDAEYGRDRTRNVASNGKAGFNYTKLDARGNDLPASAKNWRCVRDNVTGLVWERKPVSDRIIGNQGLHDADDGYTWYSSDTGNNGGFPGWPDAGEHNCFGYKSDQPGTWCNTEAYVNRVNAVGWCGKHDWRLPDRFELRGLVDMSVEVFEPTIDTNYFPDFPDNRWLTYWSSSPDASDSGYAWDVFFVPGYPWYNRPRSWETAVRLVRGGQ